MSQESSAANVEAKDGAEEEYVVGAYVELQGTKKNTRRGFIRFKGKIKNFGECVGVELDASSDDKGGGAAGGSAGGQGRGACAPPARRQEIRVRLRRRCFIADDYRYFAPRCDPEAHP